MTSAHWLFWCFGLWAGVSAGTLLGAFIARRERRSSIPHALVTAETDDSETLLIVSKAELAEANAQIDAIVRQLSAYRPVLCERCAAMREAE